MITEQQKNCRYCHLQRTHKGTEYGKVMDTKESMDLGRTYTQLSSVMSIQSPERKSMIRSGISAI